jgi:carbon storage regulator
MIGSDIKITIVKVERNQVRIGIEAPRGVTILRDELIADTDEESDSAHARIGEIQIVKV